MNAGPIDLPGLTSDAFVRRAAQIGLTQHTALAAYRAFFRDGAALPPNCTAPALVPGRIVEQGTTRKFLLTDTSGLDIETVILPQTGSTGRVRTTLCVSSQIGCAMGCTFCETGQMGRLRQLQASEIVAQWHVATHTHGASIDNIVFMGMGEPMDNLDAVIAAIEVFVDHNGPALAPSGISVSTVGVPGGIRRLAELAARSGFHGLNLAVSLNAPNDAIRSQIMPLNRAVPIDDLLAAVAQWPQSRRRRVLIEYVLIPGVNAELAHADELALRLANLPVTVNVIPYNPRRNSPWPAPSDDMTDAFTAQIAGHGLRVRRRRTMGRDVAAACGQLGNQK